MSRADDLTPLLRPAPPERVGYRQGLVLSWNQTTGANTVQVGAATLTNVPFFNTSTQALLLTVGDVVGILTVGTGWVIVGRISVPPL